MLQIKKVLGLGLRPRPSNFFSGWFSVSESNGFLAMKVIVILTLGYKTMNFTGTNWTIYAPLLVRGAHLRIMHILCQNCQTWFLTWEPGSFLIPSTYELYKRKKMISRNFEGGGIICRNHFGKIT